MAEPPGQQADDRSHGGQDEANDCQASGTRELTLDELSRAYAEILVGAPPERHGAAPPAPAAECEPDDAETADPASPLEDDAGEVNPLSILEAMLFLGHPENRPLTSQDAAALMRDVEPGEIDPLVRQLNSLYDAEGRPYRIQSVGPGYCLRLREEYSWVRERFYRRVREARLSQAAIDVLAVVAYNQPLTREEIDRIRGKPTSDLLRQLVRRQLLRIERTAGESPPPTRYRTTDRFLDVFGLDSLGDLPQPRAGSSLKGGPPVKLAVGSRDASTTGVSNSTGEDGRRNHLSNWVRAGSGVPSMVICGSR